MTHLLIDIESTGFSAKKHSIVEIGWAWTDDDFKILHEDQIYILAQDGKEVSQEAIDVNGYNEDLWLQQGAVPLADAAAALHRKIEAQATGKHIAWAHNASFDKQFVQHYFPFMNEFIAEWRCSMAVFREFCKLQAIEVIGSVRDPNTKKVIAPGTLTLAGVAKLAGADYIHAHGSLDDCRTLSSVMSWARSNKLVA